MPFTHTITRSYSVGGRTLSATTSYTGDAVASLNVSIANGASDLLTPFSMERGNGIVAMVILSDQAMTFKTNATGAPVGGTNDAITLIANVPYIWHTGWYDTILITADITALYMTNSSGSAATLQVEILTDVFA